MKIQGTNKKRKMNLNIKLSTYINNKKKERSSEKET